MLYNKECTMQLVVHPKWMDNKRILRGYRLCIHFFMMFLCHLGRAPLSLVMIGRLSRVILVMISTTSVP